MTFDPQTPRSKKQKAPPRSGASATDPTCYLLTEAVHQATLQPQVVLLCAAKVRVQILDLDRAERQVAGQLQIGAAAKRHRERIHRARRKARHARRQSFSTEQHLRVGSKPAGIVIREARTEQVVDFMRSGPRRQPRDLAATDVANNSEKPIHIDRERAARTLTARAGITLAWIDSDILILSRNLHAPGFLGLRNAGRQKSEPEQNE